MVISLVQSVEGMKVVCHELTQATADPESSTIEELVKEADRLVSSLATMVIASCFQITVPRNSLGFLQ